MGIRRFDVGSWLDSPLSRRRLDLSQFAKERAEVAEICARIAADGDAALREYGQRFDGWAPRDGETFQVPKGDLVAAANRLPSADRAALEFAAQRIRDFHLKQVPPATSRSPGLKLVTRPVRRAGVYAPGGRAAYPSTVLMTAIPARVAGVSEVILATPPRADGSVPAPILAAARVAADLAAQLEHDPLAWAVLVTDSARLADRVEEELDSLVRGLERAEIIRAA